MAQPQEKPNWDEAIPPVRGIQQAIASPSPARALQRLLDERTGGAVAPVADADRWSPRRTLAFVVVSSSALWLALIAIGARTVQMVA